MLGDAAYPLSDKLLIPYPGKNLPPDKDAFNFCLSQLRVSILVGQWVILWRPLRVQFAGRGDLITALFRLYNFLRDDQVQPIHQSEEDSELGLLHPQMTASDTLPDTFATTPKDMQKPTRSGC